MSDATLNTDFVGRRGRLFWLALRSSVLTVLTLGIYRFWMKTRLRRYYWSSIRPGGVPLEYVGRPTEKLLGFLIAVVFLAFYIGVVNLILMFASFAILHGNFTAYVLSFVGVIPILFFAQYRARRYVLARTRWRGIRFGLEPGAWGYAWRALVHWLITIVTLGILWPRKTFWLEKYKTDRTYFGTQPMTQGGRWTMLIRPFLPHLLGVALTVGIGLAAIGGQVQALPGLALSLPLMAYGLVHFRVRSFQALTNAKTAGPVGFNARPRPWRVLRIYALGFLAIALIVGLVAAGFGAVAYYNLQNSFDMDATRADPFELVQQLPTWVTMTAAIFLYFTAFILYGVLVHTFLTLPLMRHYAETLEITGTERLDGVTQRGRDEFTEAEGFAEALDVGAGI